MLHIAPFKIDNLRILTAQLDGDVCLGRIVLQGGGHGDDFLHERHVQVLRKRQTAASRDDGADVDGTQLVQGASQKVRERLLDIGIVPLIV